MWKHPPARPSAPRQVKSSYSAYLPDFGGWQQSGKNRQEAGTTVLGEPITALWVSLS